MDKTVYASHVDNSDSAAVFSFFREPADKLANAQQTLNTILETHVQDATDLEAAIDLLTDDLPEFTWLPFDTKTKIVTPFTVLRTKLEGIQGQVKVAGRAVEHFNGHIRRGEILASTFNSTVQSLLSETNILKGLDKLGDSEDFHAFVKHLPGLSEKSQKVIGDLPNVAHRLLALPEDLDKFVLKVAHFVKGEFTGGLDSEGLTDEFRQLHMIGSMTGLRDIQKIGLTGIQAVNSLQTLSKSVDSFNSARTALSFASSVGSALQPLGSMALAATSIMSAGLGFVGLFSGGMSLFGGGDDDEIGEALGAISYQIAQVHQAVETTRMEMHQQFHVTQEMIAEVYSGVVFVSSQVAELQAVTIQGFNHSFALSRAIIDLTTTGFRDLALLQDELAVKMLAPMKHAIEMVLVHTRYQTFIQRQNKIREIEENWTQLVNRVLRHLGGLHTLESDKEVLDVVDKLYDFTSQTVFHPSLTGEDILFSDDAFESPAVMQVLIEYLSKIVGNEGSLIGNIGLLHALNKRLCNPDESAVCKVFANLPIMPHPLLWSSGMNAYMRMVLLLPADLARKRSAELDHLVSTSEDIQQFAILLQSKLALYETVLDVHEESLRDMTEILRKLKDVDSQAVLGAFRTGAIEQRLLPAGIHATIASGLPHLAAKLSFCKLLLIANARASAITLESLDGHPLLTRLDKLFTDQLADRDTFETFFKKNDASSSLLALLDNLTQRAAHVKKQIFSFDMTVYKGPKHVSPLMSLVAFERLVHKTDMGVVYGVSLPKDVSAQVCNSAAFSSDHQEHDEL